MAFNKSAIDAVQAYHMDHKKEIYTRTFSKPITNNFMMVTTKDKLMLTSGNSTEVLQGHQKGHHSKGDISLSPRVLEMRMVKADNTIETRELDTDYYFAYLNASGNNPRNYPYEAWALDMIYNQMYEDVALSALWGGVYSAPIPGTPNAAADTMDGGLKLLNDEITATNLVPTVTGGIATGTAVAQVRNFTKSNLDTAAKRARRWITYCSQDLVDKYQSNYEDLHGAKIHSKDPFTLTRIDGTNNYLVPQDGLQGDELIMCRPNNFILGLDGSPYLDIRYQSRELFYEIDWKIGLQYHSNMEMYVNDQL